MTVPFRVEAPASTSNLGPGFDTLGLALDLHVRVEVRPAESFRLTLEGAGSDTLPTDNTNRIVACARELAGSVVDQTHWHVRSEIPVARGLGSSAAACAAGLAAGQRLARKPLNEADIFHRVLEIEQHADNAAATVFGGFRIAGPSGDGRWRAEPGVIDSRELRLLLLIPAAEVATETARSILPDQDPRSVGVANLQSLGMLISGLARADWDVVRHGCRDQMHEPHRLPLVPGLDEALAVLRSHAACAGAYLSGAGPTLAAFVPDPASDIDAIGVAALQALESKGTHGEYRTARVEPQGVCCRDL